MHYTVDESREWYNNLPGKRSSAGVIVRFDDKILMVKDDYKPAMTFPGGAIDLDEAPKHAAIRETLEEVGLTLDPQLVSFFTALYVTERMGFKDCYHFFFIIDIDETTAASIVTEEGIEYYKWVDPDEIGELAGQRPLYQRVGEMLMTKIPLPYLEL
ncbi:hypothetical protein A2707_02975 [Candidatus Saccharibacteria bacterium RIFCSPHIGHO2_01_FULL_45_15]|nr:MAG: hypothetical protein A2707_02975 [Candidatus Saccharibacteria bacterium RIFCSPHIGHO2_01_FULL_45_15]OGL27075.1 MAG: hypothetical protein A3C39_00825 [Candidatus Saccharibacteria bacterium RIFCSPHIGHO2_02_FULL_46_12]OGL32535.1 MAG: hypothetical protein A3E76_00595 [Candidatus Saccharibacteria bacterium RIFCSPHIGHO2_12_FULL_44_22]